MTYSHTYQIYNNNFIQIGLVVTDEFKHNTVTLDFYTLLDYLNTLLYDNRLSVRLSRMICDIKSIIPTKMVDIDFTDYHGVYIYEIVDIPA